MATLKLERFPETRTIPLGCYAENVSSITYRVGDETCRYRDVLIRLCEEGGQSVVRDVAGQFWPADATDVVIEYTPLAKAAKADTAKAETPQISETLRYADDWQPDDE